MRFLNGRGCVFITHIKGDEYMEDVMVLENKIRNNESLSEKEYTEILTCRRYQFISNLFELDNCHEEIVKDCSYMSTVGLLMGMDKRFLSLSYGYYVYAMNQAKKNYRDIIDITEQLSGRVCRFNMSNFMRQYDEIQNYNKLLNQLDKHIMNAVVENDISSNYKVIGQNMNDLENSKVKIRTFQKKYIK